jgi:hypothetical protein
LDEIPGCLGDRLLQPVAGVQQTADDVPQTGTAGLYVPVEVGCDPVQNVAIPLQP